MRKGKLYGIGVGPGDPEMLTIKARKLLEEMAVLLVPKSRQEKRSLALSIVESYLPENQQQLEIILPMTRDQNVLLEHWQKAARQVLDELHKGKDCGFITLGDPGTYSTFAYLWRHVHLLDAEIEVEMIPGVSAVNQTGALAGEILVEGDESLAVITALKSPGELEEILDRFENVVVLKAGRYLEQLTEFLESRNGRERAVLVSRGGFDDAFIAGDLSSLSNLKDKSWDYLSTVVIKRKTGWGEMS